MAQGCVKRGQVEMAFRTHGGKRPGAGRKPKGARAGARHVARPEHDPRHPVHVTTRIVGSASAVGLRRKDTYLAIREATIVTARRENFWIVHMSIPDLLTYQVGDLSAFGRRTVTSLDQIEHLRSVRSKKPDRFGSAPHAVQLGMSSSRTASTCQKVWIQRDHLHMIVEAESKAALSRGMRGFSISAARQINRAISACGGDRRTGRVISDRFHARPLTSPRAVRNTLAYVLSNWRRHGEDRSLFAQTWKVDPYSSGALFPGWQELTGSPVFWPLPPTYLPLIVFRPRTWLLCSWDRFHPLISVREVPGRR